MDDIRLRLVSARNRNTIVPNIFIDEYMTGADGEYVKVYLYLLRALSKSDSGEKAFSVSAMADALDHTERDIRRALSYWEKKGLVGLEFDSDRALTGISLLDLCGGAHASSAGQERPACTLTAQQPVEDTAHESRPAQQPVEDTVHESRPVQQPVARQTKPSPSEIERGMDSVGEDVMDVLRAAEMYMGRPLTQPEIGTFFSWNTILHMDADMISYLIESCIESGHADFSYMDAVAGRWHEKGITTPAEAESFGKVYSTTYYAVLKAFGISGRKLSSVETEYVDKWVRDFGFENGLIAEACRKTILRLGQVSFPYADSILSRWHDEGVKTIPDVEALDRRFEQQKSMKPDAVISGGNASSGAPTRRLAQGTAALNPKIHNFEEHDYGDWGALEKRLLQEN